MHSNKLSGEEAEQDIARLPRVGVTSVGDMLAPAVPRKECHLSTSTAAVTGTKALDETSHIL
jgi:hypothetical protein